MVKRFIVEVVAAASKAQAGWTIAVSGPAGTLVPPPRAIRSLEVDIDEQVWRFRRRRHRRMA